MKKVFRSISSDTTQIIAKEIMEDMVEKNRIKFSNVILLNGNLGSGKTVFVKGALKYFGIIADKNISPTFVIIKRYITKNNNAIVKNIYHIDAYRISKKDNLESIGIHKILEDKNSIVFIEWPENMRMLFNKINKYNIYFKYCENENEREIILK